MESSFYSNSKDLLIVFGGKIGVGVSKLTFGREDDSETYHALFFQELSKKYKVGEQDVIEEISDEKVVLCFNDVEQVDVVINNLLKVKKQLENK